MFSVNGALACPCSKEMCNGLTHNQRGNLSIDIDVSKGKVEFQISSVFAVKVLVHQRFRF